MCMLTMCFFRFPLWSTTFWHTKHTNPTPSSIFAIIDSSRPEKLGFSTPSIHVWPNWHTLWEYIIWQESFKFYLQGVISHVTKEAVKPSKLYALFPCAFWDCPWSWPPFHRVSRTHECWPYALLQCAFSRLFSFQTCHIQYIAGILPSPSPDTGQLHHPVLWHFLEKKSLNF